MSYRSEYEQYRFEREQYLENKIINTTDYVLPALYRYTDYFSYDTYSFAFHIIADLMGTFFTIFSLAIIINGIVAVIMLNDTTAQKVQLKKLVGLVNTRSKTAAAAVSAFGPAVFITALLLAKALRHSTLWTATNITLTLLAVGGRFLVSGLVVLYGNIRELMELRGCAELLLSIAYLRTVEAKGVADNKRAALIRIRYITGPQRLRKAKLAVKGEIVERIENQPGSISVDNDTRSSSKLVLSQGVRLIHALSKNTGNTDNKLLDTRTWNSNNSRNFRDQGWCYRTLKTWEAKRKPNKWYVCNSAELRTKTGLVVATTIPKQLQRLEQFDQQLYHVALDEFNITANRFQDQVLAWQKSLKKVPYETSAKIAEVYDTVQLISFIDILTHMRLTARAWEMAHERYQYRQMAIRQSEGLPNKHAALSKLIAVALTNDDRAWINNRSAAILDSAAELWTRYINHILVAIDLVRLYKNKQQINKLEETGSLAGGWWDFSIDLEKLLEDDAASAAAAEDLYNLSDEQIQEVATIFATLLIAEEKQLFMSGSKLVLPADGFQSNPKNNSIAATIQRKSTISMFESIGALQKAYQQTEIVFDPTEKQRSIAVSYAEQDNFQSSIVALKPKTSPVALMANLIFLDRIAEKVVVMGAIVPYLQSRAEYYPETLCVIVMPTTTSWVFEYIEGPTKAFIVVAFFAALQENILFAYSFGRNSNEYIDPWLWFFNVCLVSIVAIATYKTALNAPGRRKQKWKSWSKISKTNLSYGRITDTQVNFDIQNMFRDIESISLIDKLCNWFKFHRKTTITGEHTV